jgi:D-alanyl-D-alanine carboxypeptidase/D-alanyl-D-alanine-endopeptidase (penicillin-binding protein 4)
LIRRLTLTLLFIAVLRSGTLGSEHELGTRIEALISNHAFATAQWGICVYSLTGDSVVFRHNDNKLFVPGSTIKLFTSAAALDSLGSNYCFQTEFIADGTLDDSGTLWGDLVIRGSGDPTLSDIDTSSGFPVVLQGIAHSLRQRGLRQVRGHVVGDARAWKREPICPSWEVGDLGEEWMPVPGALSIGHAQPIFDTTGFVVLDAMPDSVMPLGPSPTPGFLSAFGGALKHAGITVIGNEYAPSHTGNITRLFVYSSPPLLQIISTLNKESNNFYAEQLCRVLGNGSWREGVQTVGRLLAKAGIDTSRIRFADGSGLSRKNLVTPEVVVQLLRHMHRHAFSDGFEQSLAVMGQDGTLAERPFDASGAEVRAKTGTLTYASALSGYVITDEGKEFAFSILCNGFLVPVEAVHQVQDSICSLIAMNAEALSNSGRVKNPTRR